MLENHDHTFLELFPLFKKILPNGILFLWAVVVDTVKVVVDSSVS